jgi:serine/threonine protein kinase
MSDRQERVMELLERWSEMVERGNPVGADELCADCPELLEELEHHIRFLGGLDRLVVPEVEPGETAFAQTERTLARDPGDEPNGDGPFPVIPHHQILGLLGAGGLGAVYRARDTRLGRVVALKVIKEGMAGPSQLARFQVEAEVVASLNHPHVVQVYEVGRWRPAGGGELPWLSMEHVEGSSLDKRLGGQGARPADAARLLRLLARAVQEAHRKGVIHRDLKPANVLLAPPADEEALNCPWGWPKLTDFGLARRVQEGDGLTHSGVILGTPGYLSPEQAAGSPEVGPPTDVYGLGAVLYRMLTGRPPFGGANAVETLYRVLHEAPTPPRLIQPATPAALERLCLSCLEKDPARRPGVAELIAGLERFLAGEETTGVWKPADGAHSPTGNRSRRLVLAGLVAAALVIALGLAWRRTRSPDKGALADEKPAPPLTIHPLRVMHHARTADGLAEAKGAIGEKSFATRFGDAVTIRVELSAPGYLYLLAFNADGKEQLLWPADERSRPLPGVAPEKVAGLLFPLAGKRFTLNDEPRGGLQVFAALASRRPLPAYEEWKARRGEVAWRKRQPGPGVWQANEKGVYEAAPEGGATRGGVEAPWGAPPLAELCRGLLVGGVEAVEAVAFAVRKKADP